MPSHYDKKPPVDKEKATEVADSFKGENKKGFKDLMEAMKRKLHGEKPAQVTVEIEEE